MMLQVPFYENMGEGNQCVQVAMQSVLKHFLKKDYSVEELDRLTGRKNGLWTWTSQAVIALHDLGLKVKYCSKSDLEPLLEGESFIRKHYGKDADKILKYSDIPIVIQSIKKLIKYNIFEKRRLPLDEIGMHIKQGHVPLMMIDYNKITGKKSFYQGHFVVVTGFDDKNIFYHEPGPSNPEKNKKAPKSIFVKAWNSNGTDNDVVIVYGKR